LYIRLRDGEYDHTEDYSERADVYLDVDAEGNALGLEALSFEDLAQAIEERGGVLEIPERNLRLSREFFENWAEALEEWSELTRRTNLVLKEMVE
jgi:hypothetical protein